MALAFEGKSPAIQRARPAATAGPESNVRHLDPSRALSPVRPLTVVQMLPALREGGVERGTVDLARHLVREGHRSIVISEGGGMVAELLAAGSEHLHMKVGRKNLLNFRLVPSLRRLFAQQRVDILHLRSRMPAWLGYLAWRSMPPESRPRLVTSVHGFYSVNRYSAIMTRGERVIAVSSPIRDYILENYPDVDPQRIEVIPRGVDHDDYPFGYRPPDEWLDYWRRHYPAPETRFIVTLPARLTRWKGQEHFIDIIAALKAAGLPVLGLMVGGHDKQRAGYVEELRRAIEARGLNEYLLMLGSRDDLREVMAISDVVLSLSTKPEAFGRTTLEALSIGVPVVGYDHGGASEQLIRLFPEGAVPVGDRERVVALLKSWHAARPAVRTPNPYTLRSMLEATCGVYGRVMEPAGG